MRWSTCLSAVVSLFLICVWWPAPVSADSGHARIVRLSLVQGDVRYSQQFHKDSLDDTKAAWERAPLNLPIREGFALATDNGARAEVEFENGAMAFLSSNTVIEFYDLSLDDGALVTRLVLRQGSAIFYVHPARQDFFSVTGGDFSVEADGRTRFRLDNYDDGSTVSVDQGRVQVLRNKETKALEKGESYSINVNDAQGAVIARAPENDDFDKWVSGRIDSVVTATTYANQYVNSPAYSAGFSDLYSYGGWYSVPGYGFCWQPFGVGMGWNPFLYGNWYYDASIGWNFIGASPWGWLPYHYGGWVFAPGLGWVWAPTGFGYGGPGVYRPVTAVWVHSGGTMGLVPMHPMDAHGKTPLNLSQGLYPLHGNTVAAAPVRVAQGEKWAVQNHVARGTLTASTPAPVTAPVKVARTSPVGSAEPHAVTLGRDSSIVYDEGQHRFVNNGDPSKASSQTIRNNGAVAPPAEPANGKPGTVRAQQNVGPCNGVPCVQHTAGGPRSSSAPPRPNVAPPAPHPGGTTWSGHSAGAGASSGGASSGAHNSGSGSVGGSSAGGSHASGGGHH